MPKLNIMNLNINQMHGAVDVLCDTTTLAQYFDDPCNTQRWQHVLRRLIASGA
jgi:hypothetical protein